MLEKVVVVATGSSIARTLSLLQAPDLEGRILWSTPGPADKVFAPYIVNYVKKADPNAVIVDSSTSSRPNLVAEARNVYSPSDAEVVFIISSAAVASDCVCGLEA